MKYKKQIEETNNRLKENTVLQKTKSKLLDENTELSNKVYEITEKLNNYEYDNMRINKSLTNQIKKLQKQVEEYQILVEQTEERTNKTKNEEINQLYEEINNQKDKL